MTDTTDTRRVLLIVEDEASMMRLLKDALEGEGFAIMQAATAERAMEDATTQHPDLILLDLMLPGMHGMSFLEKVREQDWGKKLPVVILTNVSPDQDIMSGVVRDEPSYYVIKANASMDEIVAKVKVALGMQRMQV
jgi:DNA-binding response OmpR family regulator